MLLVTLLPRDLDAFADRVAGAAAPPADARRL
jgi:hypothetical protein